MKISGIVAFKELTPSGELVQEWTTSNLVVNGGLAWVAGCFSGDVADATVAKYIRVGTGTTDPAATDTSLEAGVEDRVAGTTSRTTTNVTNDTYQVQGSITMTANRTISEVGLFNAGGTLLSRAVFAGQQVTQGNIVNITYKWVISA